MKHTFVVTNGFILFYSTIDLFYKGRDWNIGRY